MNEADEHMNKGDTVAKTVGFTPNNRILSLVYHTLVDLLNKRPKVKVTAW